MSQQNQPAAETKQCEHCGKHDSSVKTDRFGNVLCKQCAEKEAEEDWEE